MENKTLKIVVYVLISMVGFGLGLIAVSMFLSFIDVKTLVPIPGSKGTYNASLDLFAADWDMMDASPVFVILSYLVLLVGLVIMAVDSSIRQKLKKQVKGLNFAALAITAIGFILLIVSAIVTKGNIEDSMNKIILESAKLSAGSSVSEQELMLAIKVLVNYKLGAGTIMAIIGGVIALIGSIFLVIPAFDPIKLSAESAAAPAASAATEEQPAPTAEANENQDTQA